MTVARAVLVPMAFFMTSLAHQKVFYSLAMPIPSSHLLDVEVVFSDLPRGDETLDLQLPVWRPGRYLVLDFASGVQEFSATDGRRSLQWEKSSKSVWRIETHGAPDVRVRYKVFANEFTQRTRGLNADHAFVDGTSVFMYAEKFRHLPVELAVHPFRNWHVTTGLDGQGVSYTAPNYDYFVDCPIEVGNQKDFAFAVEGVPHVLSVFGEGNWVADTLIRDISRIVKVHKEFWGQFPYKRYVFLVHCAPNEGGGTEHINSTIMGTRPFVFRNPDSYRGFLGLVSHEFFHTWNVKQLRPRGIHRYDYMTENYTPELWIAEGMTSYYGDLLLCRAGFTPAEKALEGLAQMAQGDRQRPGNAVQSLSESSFDAWVKYWKNTEQSYNLETDYYSKGASVSLGLDLEIRKESNNTSSLDDVLRTLYARFPLSGPGYTVEDFQRSCEDVAHAGLQDFFDSYVSGKKPLPWEEWLHTAGLTVSPKDSANRAWIGLQVADVGEKTRVSRVVASSPAYEAGLDIGDEILALNGTRVRAADLNDRLNDFRAGDQISITAFRNDKLRDFTLAIAASPVPNYRISKEQSPTPLQKAIYSGWLGVPRENQVKTTH